MYFHILFAMIFQELRLFCYHWMLFSCDTELFRFIYDPEIFSHFSVIFSTSQNNETQFSQNHYKVTDCEAMWGKQEYIDEHIIFFVLSWSNTDLCLVIKGKVHIRVNYFNRQLHRQQFYHRHNQSDSMDTGWWHAISCHDNDKNNLSLWNNKV